MPLYLRRLPFSPITGEAFVALSGNYAAGSIGVIQSGFSKDRWQWGGGFNNEKFWSGGTVDDPAEAKPLIAAAFRRAIARAGLVERDDARPGDTLPTQLVVTRTPERDVPRDIIRRHVIDWPRRAIVYSGELMVGILNEMAYPEHVGWWTYAVNHRFPWPHEDFQWFGIVPSLDAGFDAIATRWSACTYFAGLEQRAPLRQGKLMRSLT